jgi:hypothetical protein
MINPILDLSNNVRYYNTTTIKSKSLGKFFYWKNDEKIRKITYLAMNIEKDESIEILE